MNIRHDWKVRIANISIEDLLSDSKKDPKRVAAGRKGGRPRRYDLGGMKIGESQLLPWQLDISGKRVRRQDAIHEAVRRESIRLGQTFRRHPVGRGLLVVRIS